VVLVVVLVAVDAGVGVGAGGEVVAADGVAVVVVEAWV